MVSERQRTYSLFAQGIALCFLGAVCFSTKAIIVKLAYRETQVDPVSLLALRMLFSMPFFLISAAVSSARRSNVRFTPGQWMSVALIGCLGYYVSSLLDFVGLRYISAGMERLILFIYPTLVLLLAAMIYGHRVHPRQWIALLITYAGLVLAFTGELKIYAHDSAFYFGSFMIFGCAFTYAAYIVGSGRLIPVIGAAKFNSYAMSFACAAVLIHFLVVNEKSLLEFELRVYSYSVLMAIVSTVIPTYLISAGIRLAGSGNAAIVGSVGPVSTIILAYYFLGESFSRLQVLGTLLILGGVWVISTRAAGRAPMRQ